jgi:hypothetical protein
VKLFATATIATLLMPAGTWAQAQAPNNSSINPNKKLDLNFPNLAAKAAEKSEVDLDGAVAKAAAGGLGVTGIFVRHYEFEEAGAYSERDLDPLRKQVAADPAWMRVLSVKEKGEDTQIFMRAPGADQDSGGFLVIATEATEVNVVQILGTIELSRLQELVKSSISYDLSAAAGAK